MSTEQTHGRDPDDAERDSSSTPPSVPDDSDSVSPQAHDTITPHDLPVDHPGREEAEREAREQGGETRGNV
jgi:hypothetical protein